MELLVSIDLGSTRLKVAAFAFDGTLAHLAVRRHETHEVRTASGVRRWQYAERWWEDTVDAFAELRLALPGARVLGISLSGRGGAAVFSDAQGEVIADPWEDGRHVLEARELVNWRADHDLSNAGLQLIAKYLWLVAEHPEAAADIAHGFFAKDWLLFRLTGIHATDWTSGPDGPRWDPALDELDLPLALLPQPRLPWEIAGTLSSAAATQLQLPRETPVAVGAHDGLAANIGAGSVEPGQYALTLGTHAVVRAVQASLPAGAYRFYGFPPAHHVIGGNAVLAGRSVDWFIETSTPEAGTNAARFDYAGFERLAAGVAAGAAGVRFLPFLAGQVAPEARPGARALFSGLGLGHGRGEMYRAVLEGASFAMKNIFDQVVGWCGEPEQLRATGGGAESPLWMELLAAILGEPIELTGSAVEGRGAAICLAVALGIHPDLTEAARAMVRVEREVQPQSALVEAYRTIYTDWSRVNDLSRGFDRDP